MVIRSASFQESSTNDEKDAKPKVKAPSISYFSLYRFTSRLDKALIAVALLATFIAAITLPYAITLVANTFQNMITYAKAVRSGKEDANKFLKQMHNFGIQYSCVGVVLFVGGYLGTALMHITATNQIYKIRQAYLRAVLNQDLEFFDLHQTGDFASRMADDVIKLEEGIGDKVSVLVYNLTMAVGCVSMAIYKGWKFALMCLTTIPVTLIMVGLTGKIATALSKKEALASGQASAIAQEVLGSIRTVYAFNGQQKELLRYKKPLARARKIQILKDILPPSSLVQALLCSDLNGTVASEITGHETYELMSQLFTGLSMGFLFFCIFGSYALSFYFGIYLVINDPQNYNADVMFSVFFGIMTGMGNFGMVGSLMGSFGAAKGAGAQIFQIINNIPTINPLLDKGLKPKIAVGDIELVNVVFKYPARSGVPVLNGLCLKVNHGQSIALVGHSGSGKSTVIALISRYYDVLEGSIRFDGHDVRDLSVSWLRAQIGLVSQEPTLFNASVRDNIRYGRDDATDAEVEAAAKKANAHKFIIHLPKGYDTQVGERGASLSGGQKQRIAIARAIVRNPLILLLDEATSALDLSSEAKVQKALEKAAEGRTTITVAHRLSTIRKVDYIYVLKQGNVVEAGSHEQLMKNLGHYYDMVIAQEPQFPAGSKDASIPMNEESVMDNNGETADMKSVMEDRRETPVSQKLSFLSVISLNSPEWKSITIGCLGSIFIGFSLPFFIVVFGDMFGAMSDTDTNKLMEKGKKVSVTCILIGVVMGLSNLVESLSFGVAGSYLTERLRVRMFSHMLKQHIGYFDDRLNSTGALCTRLSAEAAYVQGATGQRIGILLQGISAIGLALVVAMLFQWQIGLVLLAFFPVIAVVVYHQAKQTGRESSSNAVSLENSTKIAVEAVSNIRTVAALGRERRFLLEYTTELQPTLAPSRRAAHCRGIVSGISRSMFNFLNAAALTYGGHLIVSQGVAYEDILVTTQSLQIASGQLHNAFTFAPDFQKGIMAASRIVAQLNLKPKIFDPPSPAVTGFISEGEASFKEVNFRYPTRPDAHVLRGLNLQVESGKTVAVVGSSGCGKSTVVQLLQRFYDPDSGVVCLDQHPLPRLKIDEVRSSFGLVSQEPVLFDLSIRENIAYGDNSRNPTMLEIMDAARQANIHDFIVSLPEGYETNIGSKGAQLSGGQKQRVAIARALIRHPRILLLDEATSALDTENEKMVMEGLERGRAGRTCVVVAHRPSAIRGADVIVVVEAGRAVESGPREQLLRANGPYAKLYRTDL